MSKCNWDFDKFLEGRRMLRNSLHRELIQDRRNLEAMKEHLKEVKMIIGNMEANCRYIENRLKNGLIL